MTSKDTPPISLFIETWWPSHLMTLTALFIETWWPSQFSSYFFVGTAGPFEKACRGSKRKNIFITEYIWKGSLTCIYIPRPSCHSSSAAPIQCLSLWKLSERNSGQWLHNVALLILSSLRTYRHAHITSEMLLFLSLHLTSSAHLSCLLHDRIGPLESHLPIVHVVYTCGVSLTFESCLLHMRYVAYYAL